MKHVFYFILKALFILKILKFLSWLVVHVEKTAWLERYTSFQNLRRHNLVNKQSQYTYSHGVKAMRESNLACYNK